MRKIIVYIKELKKIQDYPGGYTKNVLYIWIEQKEIYSWFFYL